MGSFWSQDEKARMRERKRPLVQSLGVSTTVGRQFVEFSFDRIADGLDWQQPKGIQRGESSLLGRLVISG